MVRACYEFYRSIGFDVSHLDKTDFKGQFSKKQYGWEYMTVPWKLLCTMPVMLSSVDKVLTLVGWNGNSSPRIF